MKGTREFNFDGIVGPTHNYAGLAFGNLASQENRNLTSHPRAAALQGLAKMKVLADLGVPQCVLPPQARPRLDVLRRLGFTGSDAAVAERAAREAPRVLAACYSASAMWAANAATVSPSADSADGRVHFTPANLASHMHRSLETTATAIVLRDIFCGGVFAHHEPLPAHPLTTDEGAANHTRLGLPGMPGLQVFVHGPEGDGPVHSRQMRSASEAVARLHQLVPDRVLFLKQNPAAIAAGVFHNDVIAVGHEEIFIHHEEAFSDTQAPAKLKEAYARATGRDLAVITVPASLLSLRDAVRSYLFNSQVLTLPQGNRALIAPLECREIPAASAAVDFLCERVPGMAVHVLDVRESMRNGGGPACLRLRVLLTPAEAAAMHPGVLFTEALHGRLKSWIEKHYRETLAPGDLADPALIRESAEALAALREMGIPAVAEVRSTP